MKKASVLAKKALDKNVKKIQAITKVAKMFEEKAIKNIESATKKIQNRKCKSALASTSGPFKKE